MADGGTVKLPGIGPVEKKYVYAGGALVVGIVGYAWWRAGSSGGGVIDPNVDSSGLTGDPAGGGYRNPNPQEPADPDAPHAPTTNQEWAAAATEALERGGYDTGFIAATLGKYLDHQGLNLTEAALVRVAWAFVGRPPVGSFPIVPIGGGLSAPGNLRTDAQTTTSIHLVWNAVSGATGYQIFRGGSKVGNAAGTSWNATGLKPGTSYSHQVKATAGSSTSAGSNTVTVKTKGTATVRYSWQSVKTSRANDTIKALQTRELQGSGRNAAQVASIVAQAAARSRVRPTQKLRAGTWVNIFRKA